MPSKDTTTALVMKVLLKMLFLKGKEKVTKKEKKLEKLKLVDKSNMMHLYNSAHQTDVWHGGWK